MLISAFKGTVTVLSKSTAQAQSQARPYVSVSTNIPAILCRPSTKPRGNAYRRCAGACCCPAASAGHHAAGAPDAARPHRLHPQVQQRNWIPTASASSGSLCLSVSALRVWFCDLPLQAPTCNFSASLHMHVHCLTEWPMLQGALVAGRPHPGVRFR